MFLKPKPLPGDRNLLVLVLTAMLMAGCSSLQPDGPSTASPVAVVSPGASDADVAGETGPLATASSPLADFESYDDSNFEAATQQALAIDYDALNQQAESELAQIREREAEFELQRLHEAEVTAELEREQQRLHEVEIAAELEKSRLQSNAWYRLRRGMQLTAVHNARVDAQMKWFIEHPGYMQRVMERARPILPFVLDELEQRNLPSELALLPIVESAYQAFAYSHGRASGMWQIIPSTGRYLGLKQNWWYDGRRDIIESTRAAITYLESLAKQFDGDWELALAGYNAGPGRIRSAVRYNKKHKRPTDFWHLTKFRKETRDYVPKFFALREMFAHPDKYQLDLVPINNEVSYEIVELEGQIDLALAADLAGITVNQLYQLNPAFNRWATAPKGPHRLLLPRGKAEQFKLAVAQIPPAERINWVRHKIKSGETLSHISQKYRTTIPLIREVNNIRGNQIRAGKYLMVPTATRSLNTYSLSQQSRISAIQNTNRSGTKKFHIVRPGQSLWSISRTYGVTTQALAKWNGIAPIDTLSVSQKLVVWTRPSLSQPVSLKHSTRSNALHALRYTVRKGDSLYLIANRFNIKVSDIKRWNQIGKYLQPGQKLKLYVDITSQSG
jgi:membrane-bound lytic murein transglycosylase D